MTDKFVSMTEVKDYCKIDSAEDKYDTVLDLLNEHMTASIKMWLGRDITLGTYTEVFDIDYRQQAVFLNQYPIASVVGLTHGGALLTEDEDFYVYPNTGVIKIIPHGTGGSPGISKDYWFEGLKKVEITYQAGYPTIPESIKQAALKLIHREFYDRGVDDIEKITIGSYKQERAKLADGMPMGVYTLLHPYRRQFR
jgi:hypothetical protein